MKKISLFILTLSIGIFVSCKDDKKTDTKKTVAETAKKIKLKLEPKSGSNVSGSAVFTETDGVVEFTAMISGLEPGTHAIHIHEKANFSSNHNFYNRLTKQFCTNLYFFTRLPIYQS